MKRTLLAVGAAVLISMMLVPMWLAPGTIIRPFFFPSLVCPSCEVLLTQFALQTAFAAVAAAVLVNLLPRKPKK